MLTSRLFSKVIIVGRTESNLKKAASELGNSTSYYVLDTGDLESIPSFIKTLTSEHPEVDCLINNAGVQRQVDLNDLENYLDIIDQEIRINIQGPIRLINGLLPYFESKQSGGVIMNVTSVLGIVPFSLINPSYNGSKAYMRFFTMNLRDQLKDSNVKVVEIVPPTVETDLHR